MFCYQRRLGRVPGIGTTGGWDEGEGVEGGEGEESCWGSESQPACDTAAEQSHLYSAREEKGKPVTKYFRKYLCLSVSMLACGGVHFLF